MKILSIFGTRPEAIKMCPVALELKKHPEIESIVCLTGQHREMLDQVLQVFHVTPDYDLNIMKKKQTLASITSAVLTGVSEILQKEKPDLVLVHGDTTTSFAAALAAFYENIPVGHVEAGLRTYDMKSPYPEEFNRQAVDLVTDLYFAPTETAAENLRKEGKPDDRIFVTGNTVIDALQITTSKEYSDENLNWAKRSRMILLTAHRRENWGEPLHHIFMAVHRITRDFPDVKVIYPVHKNPVVRDLAEKDLGTNPQVRLIEPLDVIAFHHYMKESYFVMTDSGGIQEEAPSLGKPVLVLRDTTERPEGIKAGTLKLIGTDEDQIVQETERLLTDFTEYRKMSEAVNPYGDGKASERIANYILKR